MLNSSGTGPHFPSGQYKENGDEFSSVTLFFVLALFWPIVLVICSIYGVLAILRWPFEMIVRHFKISIPVLFFGFFPLYTFTHHSTLTTNLLMLTIQSKIEYAGHLFPSYITALIFAVLGFILALAMFGFFVLLMHGEYDEKVAKLYCKSLAVFVAPHIHLSNHTESTKSNDIFYSLAERDAKFCHLAMTHK